MRGNKPTWVKFGLDLLQFDEVQELAHVLCVSRVEAAGYIALAVAMGMSMADDDGIIDHLSDKAIEDACGWEGMRGELINAFLKAGVFDGERDSDTNPMYIARSLWIEMAGDAIKKRTDSRKRQANKRAKDRANRQS